MNHLVGNYSMMNVNFAFKSTCVQWLLGVYINLHLLFALKSAFTHFLFLFSYLFV